MLSSITDIFNIATLHSGKEQLKLNEVNINVELGKIYEQFKKSADMKHISLKLEKGLKDKYSIIITDKNKLNQIIINLMK